MVCRRSRPRHVERVRGHLRLHDRAMVASSGRGRPRSCASLRPADEVLVVIDHNRALEDGGARASRAAWRAGPGQPRPAQGCPARATLGPRSCSGDVARLPGRRRRCRARLVGPPPAALRRPCRARRRRSGHRPTGRRRTPAWFPPEFAWVVGCSLHRAADARRAEVRNPIGANMSFRPLGARRTSVGFSALAGPKSARPRRLRGDRPLDPRAVSVPRAARSCTSLRPSCSITCRSSRSQVGLLPQSVLVARVSARRT